MELLCYYLWRAGSIYREFMMQTSKGYVLHPGESIHGEDRLDVKASRRSTGGSLTLIESHTRGGAPMHIHSREDECFYVITGSLKVWCGQDVFEAGQGSFVFLPRGVAHAWNVSGEKAM